MTFNKKLATPATILQRDVIILLNSIGFKAWVNKSGGVYDPAGGFFRKNTTGLNGVSDILGIQRRTGRLLAIELKASLKDVISQDQEDFLIDAEAAGALVGVIRNVKDLEEWLFYKCPEEFLRMDLFSRRRTVNRLTPPGKESPKQPTKDDFIFNFKAKKK